MFQNDPPPSNQSPGRALLNSWQKETTLHSVYSSAHLMRYSLRNSTGLGNSITCGQMKCFLTKYSWYVTPTNPYLHLHTPQYLQGGQNFFEKIRSFTEKNPYNFRQKIRTIRTIFEKIPTIRTFKKNKTIFENIIPF